MNDGKLIAEGGFGCTYYPSIDCIPPPKKKQNLKKRMKFVSKIQRYDAVAKNEIYIGDIVQTIMNFKSYFAPVVKHCKTVKLSQLKDKQFEDCTILFKKNLTKKYIIVESPYIDHLTLFKYMIDVTNNKKMILNILSTYTYLITAIIKLYDKKIIHYDLKGENIVYDTKRNIPIIIDFGLSIPLNKVKKKTLSDFFYIYSPEYYVWSPEIHYLCYMLKKNDTPSKKDITNLAKVIVKNNIGLQCLYSKSFLKQYTENLQQYLLTFYKKTPYEVYTMIEPYSNTWDNFSISMIYMRILYFLNGIDGFTDNKFIIYFSKLLLQNAHPNPKRRLTPNQTIDLFNKYFYTSDINVEQDYEELLHSLTKNKSVISTMITADEVNLNYSSE